MQLTMTNDSDDALPLEVIKDSVKILAVDVTVSLPRAQRDAKYVSENVECTLFSAPVLNAESYAD